MDTDKSDSAQGLSLFRAKPVFDDILIESFALAINVSDRIGLINAEGAMNTVPPKKSKHVKFSG